MSVKAREGSGMMFLHVVEVVHVAKFISCFVLNSFNSHSRLCFVAFESLRLDSGSVQVHSVQFVSFCLRGKVCLLLRLLLLLFV